MKDILIVSATKKNQIQFERFSLLGVSLKKLSFNKRISSKIKYDNKDPNAEGLGVIYNRYLTKEFSDRILLFVHDDVYIDDFFLLHRLNESLKKFDVVGLAGGNNLDLRQPTWGLKYPSDPNERWQKDAKLSGAVAHIQGCKEWVTSYGEPPAKCQLLDGCFIAVNTERVVQAGAEFDNQFDFHLYDLDFCRTCLKYNLKLGTWPIAVTHAGKGAYGSPEWDIMAQKYLEKWKTEL